MCFKACMRTCARAYHTYQLVTSILQMPYVCDDFLVCSVHQGWFRLPHANHELKCLGQKLQQVVFLVFPAHRADESLRVHCSAARRVYHFMQALCIVMIMIMMMMHACISTPSGSLLFEDRILEHVVQALSKGREREQVLHTLAARLTHALRALPVHMRQRNESSALLDRCLCIYIHTEAEHY
jgi:hypothetical protein